MGTTPLDISYRLFREKTDSISFKDQLKKYRNWHCLLDMLVVLLSS